MQVIHAKNFIIKYKYLQIVIGIIGLFLLFINVYFQGHYLTNVGMVLLALGMGIQAYTLHKQEKKTGQPINFKITDSHINIGFFLFAFSLAGACIFFVWKWWVLFAIALLIAVSAGIIHYRKLKR